VFKKKTKKKQQKYTNVTSDAHQRALWGQVETIEKGLNRKSGHVTLTFDL